ncbi:MAG: AfsR/SARP family transcriptional regulator [Jatrophihabitantaceae bacterium]
MVTEWGKRLYVQILGHVQVLSGKDLVLPSPRLARLLLGSLALRANRTIGHDQLRYVLWGDRVPKSAAANLRGYLAELRRLLRSATGITLETDPTGLRLSAVPEAVDVLLFDSLATEGHRLLSEGRAEPASERLGQALSLWRGPVMDAMVVPEPLQAEAQVLELKRQDAVEGSVDARLALGRHRELIVELTLHVAQWPLRERLCGQLMLALCRSGRQVEALSAYQALRARLDEDLGVMPNADLQLLYRRMLRADPNLHYPSGRVCRGWCPDGGVIAGPLPDRGCRS